VARAALSEYGLFGQLLRERGNRFLTVALGHPDSEARWELVGLGEPAGAGWARHRPLSETPARVTYRGFYYNHFAYGWLVLRLAAPAVCAGVSVSVSGTPIAIPAELASQPAGTLWQLPLPEGLMGSISRLEVVVKAPGWQLADVAVVGDPLKPVHLAELA
jgi:hypothetical protein